MKERDAGREHEPRRVSRGAPVLAVALAVMLVVAVAVVVMGMGEVLHCALAPLHRLLGLMGWEKMWWEGGLNRKEGAPVAVVVLVEVVVVVVVVVVPLVDVVLVVVEGVRWAEKKKRRRLLAGERVGGALREAA